MPTTNIRHTAHPGLAMAAALAAAALIAGSAQAKTIIMATDRAGTLYNATGAAIATVASKHSKHRVIVRAFGGPDAYMAALNAGDYDLSAVSSNTAWFNYNGKTKSKRKTSNLRILRSGSGALRLSFIVYADSGITKVSQLRGKRVSSDFGGHVAVNPIVTAALASEGMTWKDVRPVPVTGVLESPRALGAGRTDASWASLGMPAVREIHAKKKVRYLSLRNTPELLAMYRRAVFPGVRLVTMPPIKRLGLSKPTTLLSSDSYLVTHKNADPELLREILNALWAGTDELRKTHFSLRGFTHKSSATDLPVVPYHPVAIEFYKAKGVWTPAAEAGNAKLMR